MTELVLYALAAFLCGLIGGMVVSWRTWRDLVLDIYHHGFRNDRRCSRFGCCQHPRTPVYNRVRFQ
jgi:hypothetical protein